MLSKKPGSLTPEREKGRVSKTSERPVSRMGGQTPPPPLRWGSLFDSVVKKADEGIIVVKSGADCDAAGPPRKKKLLSRKRRFHLGGKDKGTASEF